MGRRAAWPACFLVAAMLQLLPLAGAAAAQDSTLVRLRVGPAFDAHTDLLASPLRYHGTGLGGDLTVVHGALEVTLGGGADRAGSRIESATGGFEEVWTVSADVRWARRAASLGAHTTLELGADVGSLVYTWRHQYSTVYRDYFGDMAFPLSLSVGLAHDLGARGLLDERVDVGLLTLMYRSPYAGAAVFSPGWWAGPGAVQVVRHRLRLSLRTSSHTGIFITQGFTLLATDRERPLRMVRQDVSVGVTLFRGGGRGR